METMRPPIFVRSLSDTEKEQLETALRSKDAFVMRRAQIILASNRGERAPRISRSLGCGSQTARDAIHDFNERGLAALAAQSSRPKRTRDAFDEEGAEALRGLLHRTPREFGRRRSLWTLEMAAEVAFEEGLTERRVSGETIRATLSRLLGIRWQRAKRWITSPDPLYERKKAARPADGGGRWESGVGSRLPGRVLVEPGGAAHPEQLLREGGAPSHDPAVGRQRRPRPQGHLLLRALSAPDRRRDVVEVRRRQARERCNDAVPFVVRPTTRGGGQESAGAHLGQRQLARLQGGQAMARQTQPGGQEERLWGEDGELPSSEAESVAERHRAQVGTRETEGRGVRRASGDLRARREGLRGVRLSASRASHHPPGGRLIMH